jgi:hypothetical protein
LAVEVDAFREHGYNLSWIQTIRYTEINNETISVSFSDSEMVAVDPPHGWNNIRFFISEKINLSLDVVGCYDGYNITLENLTISNLKLDYFPSSKEHITSFRNVVFNSSTPLIFHSEGASRFDLDKNIYGSNLTIWDIKLESRYYQTFLDIFQTISTNHDFGTRLFNIDCNRQTIVVRLLMNPNFGVRITANTESGFILLPNNLTTYSSPSYDLSDMKYDFIVTSTSGNITFKLYWIEMSDIFLDTISPWSSHHTFHR